MSVGIWLVDDIEVNACPLIVDGSIVTTGTATIEYLVSDGSGGYLYLQSDLTTLAATYTTIAALYNAETGWTHHLKIPASVLGKTVAYIIRHSVYGIIAAESNHVTVSSGGSGGLVVKLKA